jgi:hypothetical protein
MEVKGTSPKVTFTQSSSTPVVASLRRPSCLRPSDRWTGWDSHPLKIADFHNVRSFWHALVVSLKGSVVDAFHAQMSFETHRVHQRRCVDTPAAARISITAVEGSGTEAVASPPPALAWPNEE